MANGGGGGAAAPPQGQVYLPEWRRAFDRLVKMLRQTHAQAEALALERAHLLAELELHRRARRESEDIAQTRIQKIRGFEERRKRLEAAKEAEIRGKKDLELRCYEKLAELTENDLEDLRSFLSTLVVENNELKIKLKDVESHKELSESNANHQHSAKDLRAELRKLKQAYKTLSSQKDKEIASIRAENSFAWNQLKTMENEYRSTCEKKTIEVKQATAAAKMLQQNVDELQVAAEKKDDEIDRLRAEVAALKKDGEINRLQAEVANAKNNMLILEDELQQMRSMVKGKDVETDKLTDDQLETSRRCKKNNHETHRKSKSEGPASRETSSNSQVTPVSRQVKTSRTRACAKDIQSQSRGQSEASQKRKRGTSLSGLRRCSTRPQVRTTAMPPMFFSPRFTIPKLAPTPP